jgi:predicted transcriptional regulator YheO
MNQSDQIYAFGRTVNNMNQLVDVLCDEVERKIGVTLGDVESPKLRMEIVRQLDEFGIFSLRYAAIRVSKRMMISKVSLYNILKKLPNV